MGRVGGMVMTFTAIVILVKGRLWIYQTVMARNHVEVQYSGQKSGNSEKYPRDMWFIKVVTRGRL